MSQRGLNGHYEILIQYFGFLRNGSQCDCEVDGKLAKRIVKPRLFVLDMNDLKLII